MLEYTDLTEEQKGAISEVTNWYKQKTKPVYVIGGYAGVGKSSILPFITDELNIATREIKYCSFTGKAALVLIQKGLPATTIHGLIYDVKFDRYGKPRFVLKTKRNEDIKLIVIDEYSMINNKIMEDLLSLNIPILMLGDPGQLPPIGAANTYVTRPDYLLKTIHRQAEGSEILMASYKIRNGESLDYFEGENLRVLPKSDFSKEYAFWGDQILCGTNATRQHINRTMRKHLGRENNNPVVGDKIICLKNDWSNCLDGMYFLVNGMIGEITDMGLNKRFEPTLDFKPDFLDSVYTDLTYDERIFRGEEIPYDPNAWKKRNKKAEFDFAHAITVHKCLTEDTLVLTREGMVQIKELRNNLQEVYNGQNYEMPSAFVENGVEDIIKVSLKNGRYLEMTPNHECLVTDPVKGLIKKKAEDLELGEEFILSRETSFGKDFNIRFETDLDLDVRTVVHQLPNVMTPEFALFMGMICADGSIDRSGNRVHWSKRHEESAIKMKSLIKSLFGMNVEYKLRDSGDYFIAINSAQIARFLGKIKGLQPNQKFVPLEILKASRESQSNFLKGLFEDGSVHYDRRKGYSDTIELTFKSGKMINGLMSLLNNFGIQSTVKYREKSNLYCLMITGAEDMLQYRESIGFVSCDKQHLLNLLSESTQDRRGSVNLGKYLANSIQLTGQEWNNFKRTYVLTKKRWSLFRQEIIKTNKALVEQIDSTIEKNYFTTGCLDRKSVV